MIEHVYRRAAEARGVNAVVVATDDDRIRAAVEAFGGIARMTRPDHRSGTDRIAEVARTLACDIVINLQGDEPLIDPGVIEEVIAPLDADPHVRMTTARRVITDHEDYLNPNVVKVVVDRQGDALYFSRAPLPYVRDKGPASYKHIGLYGLRREFLLRLTELPPTPLEIAESLEQLRALEHGFRIRTIETQYDSVGVDTPEDLERARQLVTVAARR